MQEQQPGITASDQPANPQPTGSDEPSTVTIPSMQEMLKTAERQAQEHYDAWLRAKAEGDNIRKRAQADVANAHKYALEEFSGQLLPVRDSLEAALNARGHATRRVGHMGLVNAIAIDPENGNRLGAADPRHDGAAVGY